MFIDLLHYMNFGRHFVCTSLLILWLRFGRRGTRSCFGLRFFTVCNHRIQMSPPLCNVFSYIGFGISSVAIRWDHTQGSRYGLTSLEGEGLPVRPMVRTQSYRRTHLLLQG